MRKLKLNKILSITLCIAFLAAMILNPMASYATDEQELIDNSYVVYQEYSGSTYTDARNAEKAPEKDGYVFAGWYEKTDSAYEALQATEADSANSAYAKFVDDDVLGVKFQVTKGTTMESGKTDLRIVTSVDSLNYLEVGFNITIYSKTIPCASEDVYSTINAFKDNKGIVYQPEVFSKASDYFMTLRMTNINDFQTSIKVEPTWTTLDGTVVTAAADKVREVTIEDILREYADENSDYELYTSVTDGERVQNTQSIHYNFTGKGFTDTVVVKSGDEVMQDYASIKSGIVTITADKLKDLGTGSHELTISNGAGTEVTVTINVYTALLSTAEDVQNLLAYADQTKVWTTGNTAGDETTYTGVSYTGSFALTQNIRLGDTRLSNLLTGYSDHCGFNGTFDGRGYTLIGGQYYLGGMFGNVGTNAVIKNFAIVDGTLVRASYGEGGAWSTYEMAPTVLGRNLYGTMRDVLIEITSSFNGETDKGNGYGTLCGSVFMNVNGGTVQNTIVYMPTDTLTAPPYMAFADCVDGGNWPNTYLYDAAGTLVASAYSSYANNLITFATHEDNAMATAGTIKTAVDWQGDQNTFSFKLGTTLEQVSDTAADGYDDLNASKDVDLSVFDNSIWDLSGDKARFANYVVLSGDAATNVDYELYSSVKDGDRIANTKNLMYDLYENGFADTVVIKSGETDISSYATIQSGIVTIAADKLKELGTGTHEITISNGADSSVQVTINIYTALLSTAEEVQNLLAYADQTTVWTSGNTAGAASTYTGVSYTGSFALTQNIRLGDTRLSNLLTGYTDHCGFNGTFDGRGYTLIGGQYYLGGMFGNVGTNAVIKNFAIVDGTLVRASYGEGGAWSTYEMAPTVLGRNLYGTMRDVLIEITSSFNGETDKGNGYGTLCGSVFMNVNGGTVQNTIVYMPTDTLTAPPYMAFADCVDGGNWPNTYLYDAAGTLVASAYSSYANNLITFATHEDNAMATAGTIKTAVDWQGDQNTFSFKLGTTLEQVSDTAADGYDDLNASKDVDLSVFDDSIWDLTGDTARFVSYK